MDDRKQQIFEKVAALAAEHGATDVARITPQTHFVNDLNYDSLTGIEFIMAIEDEFKITVPDEKAQQLQTIEQVVDHIAEHLDGGASSEAA